MAILSLRPVQFCGFWHINQVIKMFMIFREVCLQLTYVDK